MQQNDPFLGLCEVCKTDTLRLIKFSSHGFATTLEVTYKYYNDEIEEVRLNMKYNKYKINNASSPLTKNDQESLRKMR